MDTIIWIILGLFLVGFFTGGNSSSYDTTTNNYLFDNDDNDYCMWDNDDCD